VGKLLERASTPRAFHVMAKPTGAACNLDCDYCFFLNKERLYPGSAMRMSDDVLEAYLRQYIEAQQVPEVTVTWQGGEPTMMGLDFFRRSIEIADMYAPSSTQISYTLQTNGTLLDRDWCSFLRIDAPLFFANSSLVRERVGEVLKGDPRP
jgi:uncharacterized protein